jgi:hypothetical protein
VPGDHALVLTDIIVLRKLDAVISFGDLIMAFGLVDAAYWASRRARRTRAGLPLAERHADATPVVREVLGLPERPAPTPVPAPVAAPPRRPDRTRPPKPVRVRQPVRVAVERRSKPKPLAEPVPEPLPARTRSSAGGSTSAIKQALEDVEHP